MMILLFCSAAFLLGWVLRGLLALRDIQELDALKARVRHVETDLLERMARCHAEAL